MEEISQNSLMVIRSFMDTTSWAQLRQVSRFFNKEMDRHPPTSFSIHNTTRDDIKRYKKYARICAIESVTFSGNISELYTYQLKLPKSVTFYNVSSHITGVTGGENVKSMRIVVVTNPLDICLKNKEFPELSSVTVAVSNRIVVSESEYNEIDLCFMKEQNGEFVQYTSNYAEYTWHSAYDTCDHNGQIFNCDQNCWDTTDTESEECDYPDDPYINDGFMT